MCHFAVRALWPETRGVSCETIGKKYVFVSAPHPWELLSHVISIRALGASLALMLGGVLTIFDTGLLNPYNFRVTGVSFVLMRRLWVGSWMTLG